MIILSAGMPRAGSGWYYNLAQEMALAAGWQDARQIRRRYRLQGILTEVNCNIGALTPRRLLAVMVPSLLGNTFVIKAHAAPTPLARRLIGWGQIRPLYIYRDPRDAMLSALDRGRKGLEKGRPNSFSELTPDFETSIDFMLEYLQVWEAWMNVPAALHTRYEDLLTVYDQEADRVARFLNLDPDRPVIREVIERLRPTEAAGESRGMHFNKGRIGRFREKMTPEQQAELADRFGPYLQRMGYAI